MDDTGLVSVLPPSVLVSLVIVDLSFCLAISRRPLHLPLVVLHFMVLLLMLYGTVSIIETQPRFAVGWRLAGIMNYVMVTGTVDGKIDAFFNWPGFFILMAFVTEISGFHSPVSLMGWAPVVFNLLYLGPIWMIFRAATSDLRLVALGVWFFLIGNWIGQDYLAPQAFNYFLFLVTIAIILTWLRGPAWQPSVILNMMRRTLPRFESIHNRVKSWMAGTEYPVAPSTPVQRAALIIIIVIIFVAMVPSHQLTPLATLAAISALVFFNRCSVLTLPLILGLLVATWIFYMATPYFSGHMSSVSAPVGSVASNISVNLTERFRGSPGHIFVNYTRVVMSFAFWTFAFLGGLRRFRNGYRDWGHVLVALTPFPLIAMQAYGGELLLRIYLYSVVFMSFLAAALFFPKPKLGRRIYSYVALFIVSLIMLGGFLVTRYGNERMMYFTTKEVSAVKYLYKTAAPGSQFIALAGEVPWRYQDYRKYRYTTAKPRMVWDTDINELVRIMADPKIPASYLILTRSQQAAGELFIGWPPGTWENFEQALLDSHKFKALYKNEDSVIYVLDKQKK